MQIMNDRGSLTLFVTLLLSAVLLFENLFLISAKERELEWQLSQLTDQTGDWILAAYDRDLLDQWGLYAYSTAQANALETSDLSSALTEIQERFTMNIQFQQNLASTDILKSQILNYITPLYPRLISEIKARLNAGSDEAELATAQTGLSELLASSDSISQAAAALAELKDEWGQHSKAAGAAPDQQTQGLTPDQAFLSTDLLNLLLQQEALAGNADSLPVLWQEGTIEQGLDKVLQSLSTTEALLQKAQRVSQYAFPIQLYSLLQSTSQLNATAASANTSTESDSLSLRGQDLNKIAVQYPLELEYLCSGIEQTSARKAAANLQVYSVRLCLNTFSLLKNESEMTKLERLAEVARVMILIVSLGEVQVPAAAIKWLLVLLKANLQAYADWQDLVRGETVRLMQYQPEQELAADYRLHLLPFLLIQSETELLTRLYTVINRRCPGEWFSQVAVTLDYQTPYGLRKGLRQSFTYVSPVETP
ncbi:MAG: hypothetical protein PHR21_03130 [Oscillospiraceae bacterium]|nr:hypothetical protein [Oscillospiraceae bacterium]MDD4369069.1 hypothetical protein [Oscillospiraceae bacterium]